MFYIVMGNSPNSLRLGAEPKFHLCSLSEKATFSHVSFKDGLVSFNKEGYRGGLNPFEVSVKVLERVPITLTSNLKLGSTNFIELDTDDSDRALQVFLDILPYLVDATMLKHNHLEKGVPHGERIGVQA